MTTQFCLVIVEVLDVVLVAIGIIIVNVCGLHKQLVKSLQILFPQNLLNDQMCQNKDAHSLFL